MRLTPPACHHVSTVDRLRSEASGSVAGARARRALLGDAAVRERDDIQRLHPGPIHPIGPGCRMQATDAGAGSSPSSRPGPFPISCGASHHLVPGCGAIRHASRSPPFGPRCRRSRASSTRGATWPRSLPSSTSRSRDAIAYGEGTSVGPSPHRRTTCPWTKPSHMRGGGSESSGRAMSLAEAARAPLASRDARRGRRGALHAAIRTATRSP
jgi:hypothetical protein